MSRRHGQVLTRTHGAMPTAMNVQFDRIPLAVMQGNGGEQSFNTVNQFRILGRWMRLITIPNQSSIPKAFNEFDAADRMKPSPFFDRAMDLMEDPVKFTLITRDISDHLVYHY